MHEITKEVFTDDKKHKVEIFRREDGTYGFSAYVFSDDPYEQMFIPYGRYSECIVPNEESALAEAKGRVDFFHKN